MAIKRARLSIKPRPGDDPAKGMEEVLNAALERTGLTRADIDIDLQLPEPHGDAWGLKTHFGNWLLTPVLDNEASRKLAAAMGTELDNFGEILTPEDLKNFKVNDKVELDFTTGFGLPVKSEGRVSEVTETYITIIKKGSRTKGWQPRIGDWTTLRKVEAPKKPKIEPRPMKTLVGNEQ